MNRTPAPASKKRKRKTEEDTGKKPSTTQPPKKTFFNLPDDVIDTYPDRVFEVTGITREDFKRTARMLAIESMESDSEEDDPKPDPDNPVPHGYVWDPEEDEIVAMTCCICEVDLDHWPAQCPKLKLRSFSRFKKNVNC